MTTEIIFSSVSYATKANAKRALKNICTKCLQHANEIIIEIGGRFHFNEDLVEKYMTTDEWQEVYGSNGDGLPDETITPSDEAEVAARLDAEEFHQVTEQEHAEHRGEKYQTEGMKIQQAVAETVQKENHHEAQKTSMKLDRTITCVENGEVWKNAHQMWKTNPTWMTSAQQDRLTAQLYAAAKQGDQIVVEINGRHFELVNV